MRPRAPQVSSLALRRLVVGTSLVVFATAAQATGEARAGTEAKRGYHLFRPVPKDLMRELSTDRPDLTESPYTVDAGHVQIEVDAVSLSREKEIDLRHEHLGLATANVKVGLTHRTDLQLVVPFFQRRTSLGPFGASSKSGVGNSTARLKINLWGNDGGATALAVMPFLGLPTSTLGGASGSVGVSVPLALELPGGFGSGVMFQIGVEDESTTRSATATVGHALAGPLSGYVER